MGNFVALQVKTGEKLDVAKVKRVLNFPDENKVFRFHVSQSFFYFCTYIFVLFINKSFFICDKG